MMQNGQQGANRLLDKMKEIQLGPQNSIVCQAFVLAAKDLVKIPVEFEREVYS
jgi:hypothetical protein